ncbi:secondary thiamine-phosphate synthase enzyme YjbQ [Candidatus Bipolaricaulota bacterium]|nr:secondary thiamine-phosphate synthase enzyme YjbQ [Candidatus Bipolaricaulota bacterium]
MNEITLKTSKRVELVDITAKVKEAVRKSGLEQGLCYIYVPHTTGAVTINESADPDVALDIADQLNELAPPGKSYKHREGNADSHIKSSVIGNTAEVFVEDGRLKLGTWQGIFFCEFDGPRTRKFWLKVGEL